jgi:hypothetical protein
MAQSGKFTVAGSVFRPMTNGTANRPKHLFPAMYFAGYDCPWRGARRCMNILTLPIPSPSSSGGLDPNKILSADPPYDG